MHRPTTKHDTSYQVLQEVLSHSSKHYYTRQPLTKYTKRYRATPPDTITPDSPLTSTPRGTEPLRQTLTPQTAPYQVHQEVPSHSARHYHTRQPLTKYTKSYSSECETHRFTPVFIIMVCLRQYSHTWKIPPVLFTHT